MSEKCDLELLKDARNFEMYELPRVPPEAPKAYHEIVMKLEDAGKLMRNTEACLASKKLGPEQRQTARHAKSNLIGEIAKGQGLLSYLEEGKAVPALAGKKSCDLTHLIGIMTSLEKDIRHDEKVALVEEALSEALSCEGERKAGYVTSISESQSLDLIDKLMSLKNELEKEEPEIPREELEASIAILEGLEDEPMPSRTEGATSAQVCDWESVKKGLGMKWKEPKTLGEVQRQVESIKELKREAAVCKGAPGASGITIDEVIDLKREIEKEFPKLTKREQRLEKKGKELKGLITDVKRLEKDLGIKVKGIEKADVGELKAQKKRLTKFLKGKEEEEEAQRGREEKAEKERVALEAQRVREEARKKRAEAAEERACIRRRGSIEKEIKSLSSKLQGLGKKLEIAQKQMTAAEDRVDKIEKESDESRGRKEDLEESLKDPINICGMGTVEEEGRREWREPTKKKTPKEEARELVQRKARSGRDLSYRQPYRW